jgi:threonine dehydrogenase-like Zn-dependent dehydrogenase
LVIGAGTIGLLAAQCAKADGAAEVLIGDPSADRRTVARQLGLDVTLPLGGTLTDDVLTVSEVAGADAVDIALVCAGSPNALALALEAVRPGGSIVVPALFGCAHVSFDIDRAVVRDSALYGVLGSPHRWPDAINLLATAAVLTDPLVGAPMAFTQLGEAMEQLQNGRSGAVKLIIDPRKHEE